MRTLHLGFPLTVVGGVSSPRTAEHPRRLAHARRYTQGEAIPLKGEVA